MQWLTSQLLILFVLSLISLIAFVFSFIDWQWAKPNWTLLLVSAALVLLLTAALFRLLNQTLGNIEVVDEDEDVAPLSDCLASALHRLRLQKNPARQKLEETARRTLLMLNDLEQAFFGFDVNDGVVVPHHPEYWSIKEVRLNHQNT